MLVDHHCHLDVPEFEGNREEIVARARRAGVGPIVTISMRVRQFDVYRAIAEAHEDLYFTVGTHPHVAHEELDISAAEIAALAQHPRCVGIGEAGGTSTPSGATMVFTIPPLPIQDFIKHELT